MQSQLVNLERLYRDEGPAVFSFLRRWVASRSDAEELLQEVFVTAAKDIPAMEAARSQKAWLFGIARNLVLAHRRRMAIRQTLSLTEEPASIPHAPEDARLDAMRRAIEKLPEAQREVLQLRLVDELSYAAIAEALAIPIGTVRSRLHAAMAALRTRLGARAGKDADDRTPSKTDAKENQQ